MTRILITGKSGQVGFELQQSLKSLGEIVAVDRTGLDLSNADSIRAVVREARPHIIANAAAYTAVDKAESEPELAMQINGIAPGILAEEAKRTGALLVHYSTDYVFDGSKPAPYVEADRPNPLNSYGRSKLAGEDAIAAVGGRYLIFRTSWVYSKRGSNFVRTMLRLAQERSELRVVNDQVGAPTWAGSIAELTRLALEKVAGSESSGVYHLTAAGHVSWFGFAEAIFACARNRVPEFKTPLLVPIPASDYPTPARRPANSRLNNDLFTAQFGLTMPHWRDMLSRSMEEMPGAAFG